MSYTPPKVWTWDSENGGQFASINRPVSGATHEKSLPVGKQPLQLYSLATPNGQKVSILFEELLEAGHSGAEYDAWLINIGSGDQFGSGFVDANPNSKIPALVEILMIEPRVLSNIGTATFVHRNVPPRFMRTHSSYASASISSTRAVGPGTPTLFTNMSNPPRSRSIAANIVSTSRELETSQT